MKSVGRIQFLRQIDSVVIEKLIGLLEDEPKYSKDVLRIVSLYMQRLNSLNKLDNLNKEFFRPVCFNHTKKVIEESLFPDQIKNYLIRVIRDIYKTK